jgi:hypothetical protein
VFTTQRVDPAHDPVAAAHRFIEWTNTNTRERAVALDPRQPDLASSVSARAGIRALDRDRVSIICWTLIIHGQL